MTQRQPVHHNPRKRRLNIDGCPITSSLLPQRRKNVAHARHSGNLKSVS